MSEPTALPHPDLQSRAAAADPSAHHPTVPNLFRPSDLLRLLPSSPARWAAPILLCALAAWGGEDPAPEAPATPAAPATKKASAPQAAPSGAAGQAPVGPVAGDPQVKKLTPADEQRLRAKPRRYQYPAAQYQLTLPACYERLSHEQSRTVQNELAPLFVTEAPPPDPKRPRLPSAFFQRIREDRPVEESSPLFCVSFREGKAGFEGAEVAGLEARVGEYLRREKLQYNAFEVQPVLVRGVRSLRADFVVHSASGDSQVRTTVLVPAQGRAYEITFHYRASEGVQIAEDLETVCATFTFEGARNDETDLGYAALLGGREAAERAKWLRVAYWTGGSFLAGVLGYALVVLLARSWGAARGPGQAGKATAEEPAIPERKGPA